MLSTNTWKVIFVLIIAAILVILANAAAPGAIEAGSEPQNVEAGVFSVEFLFWALLIGLGGTGFVGFLFRYHLNGG